MSAVATTIPSTDRIEKQLTLRAPVARVWKALTDALNGYRGQYHHRKNAAQGTGSSSGY